MAALAAERGIAVLIVCHNRKADAHFADDTTMGSRGFVGLARGALHLRTDPDDVEKKRRVLAAGGTNIGDESTPALAFRITGKPPKIDWEKEPLAGFHADDLMRPPVERRKGPPAEKREAAEEWLKAALKGGPVAARPLEERAGEDGISPSALRRAKDRLGVKSRQQGFGCGWVWELPATDEQPPAPQATKKELPAHLRDEEGEKATQTPEIPTGEQVADNMPTCGANVLTNTEALYAAVRRAGWTPEQAVAWLEGQDEYVPESHLAGTHGGQRKRLLEHLATNTREIDTGA